MDATTHALAHQPEPASDLSLRMVPNSAALDVNEFRISDTDVLRAEMIGLCQQAQYMRAWYAHYEEMIRATNPTAARELHDVVIGAGCTARALARAAGATLELYEDQEWGVDRRPAARSKAEQFDVEVRA
jgi:hypothetical protein